MSKRSVLRTKIADTFGRNQTLNQSQNQT